MKQILSGINAKYFFTTYCKEVGNFTHKMRGFDGHKKAIDFTEQDKKIIAAGIKQMMKDIIKQF